MPCMRSKGEPSHAPNLFLVERYWPGATSGDFAATERRIREAIQELTRTGSIVRLLTSTFIPGEESVLQLFEASGREVLVEVGRRSGLAFDRIQLAEMSEGVSSHEHTSESER